MTQPNSPNMPLPFEAVCALDPTTVIVNGQNQWTAAEVVEHTAALRLKYEAGRVTPSEIAAMLAALNPDIDWSTRRIDHSIEGLLRIFPRHNCRLANGLIVQRFSGAMLFEGAFGKEDQSNSVACIGKVAGSTEIVIADIASDQFGADQGGRRAYVGEFREPWLKGREAGKLEAWAVNL